MVAACGTELVAVRGGRVLRNGFDPVLYGNYLLLHVHSRPIDPEPALRRWDRYS